MRARLRQTRSSCSYEQTLPAMLPSIRTLRRSLDYVLLAKWTPGLAV